MSFLKNLAKKYSVVSSLQGQFNEEALSKLPKIVDAIKTAPKFEANQMRNKALQEINKAHKPLDSMTDSEKKNFSEDLLKIFKSKKWLKESRDREQGEDDDDWDLRAWKRF